MDLGTSTQITAYAMLLTLASGTLAQAVDSQTLQPLPNKFSKRAKSIIYPNFPNDYPVMKNREIIFFSNFFRMMF